SNRVRVIVAFRVAEHQAGETPISCPRSPPQIHLMQIILLTVNYKTAQTVTPEERMAELATVSRTDAPLKVRKLGAFLGAEVTGIDLTRPLDDATVKAVAAALVAHEILVFPRQTISSEDLKRFGRYFGELTVHPFSTNAAENPELIVYDNKEGNPT